MTRYLIRRVFFLIFVLWVVSILTFLIFVKLPPGNPAIRAAGRVQTPETIAAAEHAIGVDKPVWVQYWRLPQGPTPPPGPLPHPAGPLPPPALPPRDTRSSGPAPLPLCVTLD